MGSVSEPTPSGLPGRRPRRRGRLARFTAAFAVLLGLAAYVGVHYMTGGKGAPRCTVGSGKNTYEFTPEQASNAATISAVGTTRGLPERAVAIALATALQESALRNIQHGDRDSLGLFQQRPSQGWGTPEQILDPVYSSGKFYEHLEDVPGYSRLPLTVAAQKVQRSGFPQAYAKHEPDATLLAAALTGRAGGSLSCTARPADGLPGDAAQVRDELVRTFGKDLGPTALTRTGTGRAAAGAPAAGAVVSVPVRETAVPAEQRGWELAHWAVARAEALRIDEVAYAGRVWRAGDMSGAWAKASAGDTSPGTVRIRVAP
ncbi:hypothetical protein [Streptomyces solicathayae]|uniref:Heavy metal transporter n=1 Tax=Streptomyces solicathayae TaxID=3081768 RepID=A0ABZ0LTW2_9ACTN|nr:hypothetical protein [Streptomyces sp. HUAS YS2]WOX22229.1 hypothetical protein R2D22_12850 [Streptomyces sp. HUAS YS2]